MSQQLVEEDMAVKTPSFSLPCPDPLRPQLAQQSTNNSNAYAFTGVATATPQHTHVFLKVLCSRQMEDGEQQ